MNHDAAQVAKQRPVPYPRTPPENQRQPVAPRVGQI